uniref:Alpha-1,3-mannosyltransferase CMT1 n=1 Tax=Fusarium oxysporum (strain Fo5176) TaxID=660025 RepID=A0A0D2XI22_FUSOF
MQLQVQGAAASRRRSTLLFSVVGRLNYAFEVSRHQEEVENGPSLTLTTIVATTSAKIEESPSHTPTPTVTATLATTPTISNGNSPDGTSDILSALKPFLEDLGLVYFYNSSRINPTQGNARIRKLAQLRNLALTPLYKEQVKVTDETTVLFINDVSACAEDILELALQRRSLNADMTCAMDWTYVGPGPTFYDIWIARTISGDSFFEVGSDGNWNSAWNLFWNAPGTRSRYDAQQPFQVFACWNGATAFTAAPLLHGLRFRDTRKGECFQGEPQLFCKDMWSRGFRKIAVVPSVNLEYSDEKAADIKKLKGYVSDIVQKQEEDSTIDWVYDPPEQVRCMPTWDKQSWRPWNETL